MGRPPSRRGPNVVDVARAAKVSVGTVSHALNKPDIVAAATLERIERAMVDLGFVRHAAARDLARGWSDVIGLVLPRLQSSYFLDIARGADAAARDLGLSVLVASSEIDRDRQDHHLRHFDEARVRGVLLVALGGDATPAKRLVAHGRSVVLLHDPDPAFRCVAVDDVAGGALAGGHLLDRGRRRLLVLGGPQWLPPVVARHRGVTGVVEERGGATVAFVEAGSMAALSGHQVVSAVLAASAPEDRPDGIIALSDNLAAGAVRACLDAGLKVPGDVAVTGFDDDRLAEPSIVPLTTVRLPGFAVGSEAVALLTAVADARDEDRGRLVLVPKLVLRDST